MDSYKWLLFLHVAAVIVALGATFAYPFMQGFAERQGVAATRLFLRFSLFLERWVVIPGAVLILLFGVALIYDDATGYDDDFPAWLMWGATWFVLAFLGAVFLQRKNTNDGLRVLDGVPDGAVLPDAYKPIGTRIQIVGGLLGLSILGITFLMVWKPGQ